MSSQPSGGGGQLAAIPGGFRNATAGTREALDAIKRRTDIPPATLLEHQASHALMLAAQLSELKQFYEWSRPIDPADLRVYMVAEMEVLWTVLETVHGDIQRLYLSSVDSLQQLPLEFAKQSQPGVTGVTKSCRAGTRAVRAAWDALSPAETTPERHETRAETRDKAVDTLDEVAKQLRALADALSQVSVLSSQSDTA